MRRARRASACLHVPVVECRDALHLPNEALPGEQFVDGVSGRGVVVFDGHRPDTAFGKVTCFVRGAAARYHGSLADDRRGGSIVPA